MAIPLACLGLCSCGTTAQPKATTTHGKEYFPESVYGVKASPRVAQGNSIPKGGGRYQVGKPYMVKGKWYTPKEDMSYKKIGMSSWYGSAFHGRLTANGEVYDKYHLSAAHPTFPLPSYARVTNLENGSSVVVRVNDRGPYEYGRIIDVSSKAADFLDMKRKGSANVQVQYLGKAPLQGNDMPYLMASYVKKGERGPVSFPQGEIATGVMVASNEPLSRQIKDLGILTVPQKSTIETENDPSITAFTKPSERRVMPEGLSQHVMLPEIGPVPAERPGILPARRTVAYAAAYAEAPRQLSKAPFERVLSDRYREELPQGLSHKKSKGKGR